MVHIAESTIGRRYAGWFIRNTEHIQRVVNSIRSSPLPITKPAATERAAAATTEASEPVPSAAAPQNRPAKSPWGETSRRVEIEV